jgi:hypothetical protein
MNCKHTSPRAKGSFFESFLKKTWKLNPPCFLDPTLYFFSQLSSPSHDPKASKDVAPPTLLSLAAAWIFSSNGLQPLPGASLTMTSIVFLYCIYPPTLPLNFSLCFALDLKQVRKPHYMLLNNCHGKINELQNPLK